MNKTICMENLAKEIYEWCKTKELWGDNIIYFNNKAWANLNEWGGIRGKKINEDLYEYTNKNPLDYFEYANPDTLSMSFEGSLYEVLNYGNWKTVEEFEKLFVKYGYYYELGNAWNLAATEL